MPKIAKSSVKKTVIKTKKIATPIQKPTKSIKKTIVVEKKVKAPPTQPVPLCPCHAAL